jgi:parallel beta-helix repeat protein
MVLVKRFGIAVVTTLVIGIGVAPTTAGATTGTLFVGTSTVLTEDHLGQIVVTADNVTLDCAGHQVSGTGFAGISVVDLSGVTVTRCRVSGFTNGINVFRTNAVTLRGNTASGNQNGLAVGASSSASVLGNVSSANAIDGVMLTDGNSGSYLSGNLSTANGNQGFSAYGAGAGNVWFANTAHNDNGGFFLGNSNGNSLIANLSSGHRFSGFQFEHSDGTTLLANVATGNASDGFNFQDSAGNTVTGNQAKGNGKGFGLFFDSSGSTFRANQALRNATTGFLLGSSHNNTFSRNQAIGNGENGFQLFGGTGACSGNSLTSNLGRANAQWDAIDSNPSGANTWTSNNFGTTSPAGL